MSKTEATLEMSEVEISHLQHLIQVDKEIYTEDCLGLNPSNQPARVMFQEALGSVTISPLVSMQAVDLSASTDEQSLVPGERTPACFGEVPAFVWSKVIREDSPTVPAAKSRTYSHIGFRSKVCLDKRFCTMSPETRRQQDVLSSRLSNCLTVVEQTPEAFEGVLPSHVQRFKGTRRPNGVERIVCHPVANLWDHIISQASQVAESTHQRFARQSQPCGGATQSHPSVSNLPEAQHLAHKENIVPVPAAARGEPRCEKRKRSSSHVSNERREKHNFKERERRKKIRLYCDELNLLAPFCKPDSDKVTTLKWTAAFLRYINKTYGDTFKEEFQKMVSGSEDLPLYPPRGAAQQQKPPLTAEQ